MKAIIITVVSMGVISGVAGYLGGRMPAYYPVSTDARSFSEDKLIKLERVFAAKSAKYTETLSNAERKTLSQSQGYSRIEREIQHSDAARISVESDSENDKAREGILKFSAPEIPVNGKEKAVVTRTDHPGQAEVKQLLHGGETAEKQDLQLLLSDAGQKVNKDASVIVPSLEASLVTRLEASLEASPVASLVASPVASPVASLEGNPVSAPQVIESSSRQFISKLDFNYEKNFKTITHGIIPLPSPQVSSKSQTQIVVLSFFSKRKSEKKKGKVIISGIDYSIPIGSITYGNLNSLRNKLSNK